MKPKCHKCAKKVLAIALFALISWACGFGVWCFFKDQWQTPELAAIWRPMTDSHWKLLPVANLVQALAFVTAYAFFGKNFKCICCPFMRGAFFGAKIWLIAGVSGSLFWFLTENITPQVIGIALLNQFLVFVIGGAVVGKVFGNGSSCTTDSAEGFTCSTEKPVKEKKGCCGGHEKNHCGGKDKNHCSSKA